MDLYAIVGAGGFGREVMPLASEQLGDALRTNRCELVFVVEGLSGEMSVNGRRAIAKEMFLSHHGGTRYFTIAISDGTVRERIAAELIEAGCMPFTVSSRNTVILDNNQIGDGAVLCPFVTVSSNVRIGRFFHANFYSYIAHDCVIGDFVTFAPKVCCNGNVVVEDQAYIGAGAVIKQGSADRPVVIGRGAIIGMGAVVTKSVPAYTVVVGNPATPLKNDRA